MKGIDISEFQGIIDFKKVKEQVDFVMIRASQGKKEDKLFKKNAEGCIKNDIPFGVYYYSYALNVDYAKDEVSVFLQAIKPYKDYIKYPCVIDMEDGDGYKLKNGFPKNEVLVDICDTACTIIGNSGYYPMIYASLDWFSNKLNSEKLQKYNKWVAWWNKNAKVDKNKFQMWQYTDEGTIDGIGTKVDMNESFIEYDKLIAYLNNIKKIQEVKLKAGIEDLTIQFISCYKYGNFLLDKIHKRLNNPKRIKSDKEIKQVIKEEYELEDKTITYLDSYIYGEQLFLKLYRAICEVKDE